MNVRPMLDELAMRLFVAEGIEMEADPAGYEAVAVECFRAANAYLRVAKLQPCDGRTVDASGRTVAL